jgi:hypothetical protein
MVYRFIDNMDLRDEVNYESDLKNYTHGIKGIYYFIIIFIYI